MDQQEIIAGLEVRAKEAGITITEACRRAAVHPTTFSRWKKSDRNPVPTGATIRSLEKIDAVIRDASAPQVPA